MPTSVAVPSSRPAGHSIGFNLGVIALLVALGGLAAAYLLNAAERTTPAPGTSLANPDRLLSRTLGGTTLEIPASWFSVVDDQDTGFAKQVDLAVDLPLGPGGARRHIEVTLTQRSRVRPSASLLDGVYLHQFGPSEAAGPNGLIGKPLAPGDGYDSETVWYDPIASSPFVAKCQAPIVQGAAGKCLRTVYLESGIAVVYGFDDDILVNWRKFDAQMHPLLSQIGAV